VDDKTWNILVGAAREGHAAAMAEGLVMPPALYPILNGRLVGYVRLRPVRRGQDAATAISEMSNLAAAARADEVAIFWETQDIAAACEHVPLHPEPALNAVLATPGAHVVHRFPYRERQLPGLTANGLLRVEPAWLPPPPPDPDGPLEPAVQTLLDFCWQPLNLDRPDLLDQAASWLRSQGYTVEFLVYPSV
jgi:hypothetical protein